MVLIKLNYLFFIVDTMDNNESFNYEGLQLLISKGLPGLIFLGDSEITHRLMQDDVRPP
jgi:hypothetical protein